MTAKRGAARPPKPAGVGVRSAFRAEIEGAAGEVLKKTIQVAKAGDVAAIRLILDRVDPAPRDRVVEVDLPSIETVADLPQVARALIAAAGRGDLTPTEAQNLMALLEGYRKASETADLAARIDALEKAIVR